MWFYHHCVVACNTIVCGIIHEGLWYCWTTTVVGPEIALDFFLHSAIICTYFNDVYINNSDETTIIQRCTDVLCSVSRV